MKHTIESLRELSPKLHKSLANIYRHLQRFVGHPQHPHLSWTAEGVRQADISLCGYNQDLKFGQLYMLNLDVIKILVAEEPYVKAEITTSVIGADGNPWVSKETREIYGYNGNIINQITDTKNYQSHKILESKNYH